MSSLMSWWSAARDGHQVTNAKLALNQRRLMSV
jgi:hypothetical protein